MNENGSIKEAMAVVYIYLGNEKIAMIRKQDPSKEDSPKKRFYILSNPQGNASIVTDFHQNVIHSEWVHETTYELEQTGRFKGELNFTSKKLDATTGLFYFNQRYFDPMLGRFISEDPAAQFLNPYVFSNNNPVMYYDPDGELAFLVPIIAGAAIGGGVSAGINIAMQLAITGEVNFGQVLSSFGQGAAMGALSTVTGGFSFGLNLGNAWYAKAAVEGIGWGAGGMAYTGLFGEGLSWDNAWKSFGTGFISGFAFSGGKQGISHLSKARQQVQQSAGVENKPALKNNLKREQMMFEEPIVDGKQRNILIRDKRPDIQISGGRSGSKLKDFRGPNNSIIKGSKGRVYITNEKGNIIWDMTRDRVKPYIPGMGFQKGVKYIPDVNQLSIIDSIWGPQ